MTSGNSRCTRLLCLAALLAAGAATALGQGWTLSLTTDDSCYKAGDTLTLSVTLTPTGGPTPAAGFQAFLAYDPALLAYQSASYTAVPFGLAIITGGAINPAAGQVDLASGIDQFNGQTPTATGGLLATVTFTVNAAVNDCSEAITFRAHTPPTRVTDNNGNDLPLTVSNTPNFVLDSTAPVFVTCPGPVTIQCDESQVPGIPYGTISGGVMVRYNSASPENPSNQAYMKAQYSQTNTNGAAFTFSNIPLTGNGFNWQLLYNDFFSQYGFDLVLEAPTIASPPPPYTTAYDNGDNTIAGRIAAGLVRWAINDYKHNPNGPADPANVVINSLIRSMTPPHSNPVIDIEIVSLNLVSAHPIYTITMEGVLHSDGLHHWYNPATPDSPLSNFGLNGDFYFSGTLVYDYTQDITAGGDFYAGSIQLVANSPTVSLGFATATDNCTTFPVVTYSDGPHTPLPNGWDYSFVRTWTATDCAGNVSTCLQTITVLDTTAPVITCPGDITIECDESTLPAHTGTATATDNCDASPTVQYFDTVMTGLASPSNWIYYTQQTAGVTPVNGPATPPLGSGSMRMFTGAGNPGCPTPGGGGKAWLSTYAHDNTLLSAITTFSYSTYVTAGQPGIAPALNLYVDLDGNGTRDTTLVFEPVYVVGQQGPVVSGTWQTWDTLNGPGWWYTTNFGPLTNRLNEFRPLSYYIGLFPNARIVSWTGLPGVNVVVGQNSCGNPWQNFDGNVDSVVFNASTYDFEPGSTACLGQIVRNWVASDDCNNFSTCVQRITLEDTENPVLTPGTIAPWYTSIAAAEAAAIAATGAADACGGALTYSASTVGTCSAVITVTVTDCAGNSASVAYNTTIDLAAPVITCPANVTVDCGQLTDPPATGVASATDDCDTNVAISYSDDRSGLTLCNATGTILRTWTATDDCGRTATCVQTITVVDTADPILTACPGDQTLTPAAGQCSATLTYTPPTATDVCYDEGFENPNFVAGSYVTTPSVSWNEYNSDMLRVASGTDGVPSHGGGFHAVIDSTALPSPPNDWSGAFNRLRGYSSVFPPLGFCTSVDVYLDVNDAAVTAGTYAWDVSTAANNTSGGHRRDFIFHAAGGGPQYPGKIVIAGSNNSNFTRRNDLTSINHYDVTASGWYTLEWVFRDSGGGVLAVDLNLRNSGGTLLWTETRSDPSDIIGTNVGGNRYMWFTFLDVARLHIDNTRLIRRLPVTCLPPSGSVLGPGTHVVTCTAIDACGNIGNCSFNVTVNSYNLMTVNIGLNGGYFANPFDRCITFELWSGNVLAATVNQLMTFPGGANPTITGAVVQVPCGSYDCITARDRRHTLRQTASLGVSGSNYTTSFTGGDLLRSGNANDDAFIDILDFGAFAGQFNTGRPPLTCAIPFPDTDFSGDRVVNSTDFTYIQTQFLAAREANCFGPNFDGEGEGLLGNTEPLVSVTVEELIKHGLQDLVAADLNGDGILSPEDIVAFMNGARPQAEPQPEPEATPPASELPADEPALDEPAVAPKYDAPAADVP